MSYELYFYVLQLKVFKGFNAFYMFAYQFRKSTLFDIADTVSAIVI